MPIKKVLLTEVADPLLIDGLNSMGYKCIYDPAISQEKVQQLIPELEGLVVATRIVVNRQLLEAGKLLRFVARAGSGMENIDTEFAREKNITCINSPEGNANSVGEHALGFLLAFYHNIIRANSELQQLKWLVEENRVHELEGRTVGIIGYGNTGKSFARKLAPLGMKVLAFDKYLENYSDEFVKEADMQQLFKEAEIISLHIPLTRESVWLVDHHFLQQF
ncbi:MAG TPA: NAD(P)-dependent oxidoreductase, partial [Chitinophagales bacterium]|nr:NAD(P)-dependent oxidoreductase [Chitinophagales bacterium]